MRNRKLEEKINLALKSSGKLKKITRIGFGGRPWGIGKENPFLGSHVIFGVGDEVVTVFPNEKGVIVREYKLVTGTKLGEEVINFLMKNGLPVAM